MTWYSTLFAEFSAELEDRDPSPTELEQVRRICLGYWSGTPMPGETPLFEYRCGSATVIRLVETN